MMSADEDGRSWRTRFSSEYTTPPLERGKIPIPNDNSAEVNSQSSASHKHRIRKQTSEAYSETTRFQNLWDEVGSIASIYRSNSYSTFATRADLAERIHALLDDLGCKPDLEGWRTLAVVLAMRPGGPLEFAAPKIRRNNTYKAAELFARDRVLEALMHPSEEKPGRSLIEASRMVAADPKKYDLDPENFPEAESLRIDYLRRKKNTGSNTANFPADLSVEIHKQQQKYLALAVARRITLPEPPPSA